MISVHLLIISDSPGVLPHARNTPQKVKYDLYSEQVRIMRVWKEKKVAC